MDILLNIIITAGAYLFIPVLYAITGSPASLNKIKKIAAINGIVVWIVFSIILIEMGQNGAGASVFFWSYIGYYIMKKRCHVPEEDNKEIPKVPNHKAPEFGTGFHIASTDEKVSDEGKKSIDPVISAPVLEVVEPEIVEKQTKINTVTDNSQDPCITRNDNDNKINAKNPPIELIKKESSHTVQETKKKIYVKNILLIILFLIAISSIGLNIYQNDKIYHLEFESRWRRDGFEKRPDVTIAGYDHYKEFKEDNIDKLNFYDKNIVFVIDGYGNYYYTYDQMITVTQGVSKYSYWAYNKEQAISLGYRAWQ